MGTVSKPFRRLLRPFPLTLTITPMTNETAPRTFAAILELARKADVFSWHRDSKAISIITDDMPNDRRTCVEVRINSMRVEIKTLFGYGQKKPGMWSDYCAPCGDVTIEDKRGLKALMTWIRTQAERETGWPNPTGFSVYYKSKGNHIA